MRQLLLSAVFLLACIFFNGEVLAAYLPPIGKAADGQVLTVDNTPKQLHQLMGDKLVLLSFIYSSCSDVNGCPYATQVLHKISRQLRQQPVLAEQLRVLTVSFNPLQDTPEKMRQYAQGMNQGVLDWQCLTTASEQALQPLLEGYPQNVQKIYDEAGKFTGGFTHLLRVYLIDRNLQINHRLVDAVQLRGHAGDVTQRIEGNRLSTGGNRCRGSHDRGVNRRGRGVAHNQLR